MDEEKLDARARIIEVATEIVGKESNLNLTVREIASRAGVNIASINYYFRSKDNLMEEVEHVLLKKIGLIYEILLTKDDPEKKLLQWGDRLIQFLIDYPGIIYMLGARVLVDKKESAGLAEYLTMLEETLVPVLKEMNAGKEEALFYKALQLMSGVVYPVLLYSGTGKTFYPAINHRGERRKYLALLIDSVKDI